VADLTSVLEIDVKDTAFKALQADLDSFLKTMKDLQVTGTGGRALTAGGSAAAQTEQRKSREQMDAFSKAMKLATDNTTKFSIGLAKTTANIVFDSGKKLTTAFTSLTKSIVGTGGLLSGIAGMATLAGILKASQTTQQRAFVGSALGLNPNDLPRLQATYGQLFDVGSVTQTLATERERPGSVLMSQMGLSPDQAKSASMTELMDKFTEMMLKLSTLPYGKTEEMLTAFGLAGAISPLDIARVGRIGAGGVAGIREANIGAQAGTQLKDPEAWKRFGMARQLGGLHLETAMQNMLTPLLKPIDDVFHTLFQKMSSGEGGFTSVIDHAKSALEKFNIGLESGNWKPLWEQLKADFKSVWEAIKAFAEPIFIDIKGWVKGIFDESMSKFNENMDIFRKMLIEFSGSTAATLLGISPVAASQTPTPTGPGFGGTSNLSGFQGAGQKWNVRPELLMAMAQTESGFDPDIISGKRRSKRGAIGLMQFMPGTAKQYGIDPTDPEQSKYGAAHYMHDLLTMFGGSEEAAMAGYNWGQGNVMGVRKKYGKDWKAHLPRETRDYLAKNRANMSIAQNQSESLPMDRNVKVTVNNSTTNSDVTMQGARTYGAQR